MESQGEVGRVQGGTRRRHSVKALPSRVAYTDRNG
jgi:hypothetical protein